MISNIMVCNGKYLYKGIEYNNNDLNILLNKLSKKRRIILCSQGIFIKKYNFWGNKIDKYIDNKILEDFNNKQNLLFHYEIDKTNKLIYLYSIRNDNIKRLYENAKELIIEPIQFTAQKIILKKIRNHSNILMVFKVNNLNHLIKINNGLIIDTIISEEINEIKDYIRDIKDIKDKKYVLVKDKNIKEIKNIDFDYSIDLGVDRYEKIC